MPTLAQIISSPEALKRDAEEFVAFHRERMRYEAQVEPDQAVLEKKISEVGGLLGIEYPDGDMRIIGIIKDEILRLQEQVARLDREADWLANQIRDCPAEVDQEAYWDICKREDCRGFGKEDVAACWRKAAREAVEGKCQK